MAPVTSARMSLAEGSVEGPQHLAWIIDPTTVEVNTVMTPALVIHVHSRGSCLVTDSTVSIALTRIGGTGCGTLACGAGGCTKNASGGVVIFSAIQFNATGTDCQLQASAALPGGTDNEPSATFDVVPGGVHARAHLDGLFRAAEQ